MHNSSRYRPHARTGGTAWQLAIDTHSLNLPGAAHDCADISQVNPRRHPVSDILRCSPECTNHSQARGKRRDDKQPDLFDEVLPDEAAERSRATMFDVLRFAEAGQLRGHPYKAIIVEFSGRSSVRIASELRHYVAYMSATAYLGIGLSLAIVSPHSRSASKIQ